MLLASLALPAHALPTVYSLSPPEDLAAFLAAHANESDLILDLAPGNYTVGEPVYVPAGFAWRWHGTAAGVVVQRILGGGRMVHVTPGATFEATLLALDLGDDVGIEADAGTVTLTDVVISGMTSAGDGPVLLADNGSAVVLTRVTADASALAGPFPLFAGLVFLRGGTATLDEVGLTGGRAAQGGQISADHVTLDIVGGRFEGARTTAGGSGGSLKLFDCTTTISAAAFVDDEASFTGGAIHQVGGTLTLDAVTFDGGNAVDGGQLYVEGGQLTVTAGSFSAAGTSANGRGGALFLMDATASVSAATFTDDTADDSGGAIHQSGGQLELNDAILSGGAAGFGGQLFSEQATTDVSGSTFTDGVAVGTGDGGAIYAAGSDVRVGDTTFSGATARIGGAIFQDGGALDLTDVDFTGGTGTAGAAHVYSRVGTFTAHGGVWSGGSAGPDGRGGSLHVDRSDASLSGVTFAGDRARYGGAAYFQGTQGPTPTNTVALDGCVFDGNADGGVAGSNGPIGGAVVFEFVSGSAVGTVFRGNTSDTGGAVYVVDGSDVSFERCRFLDNAAVNSIVYANLADLRTDRDLWCGNDGGYAILTANTDPASGSASIVGDTFVDNGQPLLAVVQLAGGSVVSRDLLVWGHGSAPVFGPDSDPGADLDYVGADQLPSVAHAVLVPAEPFGDWAVGSGCDADFWPEAGSAPIDAGDPAGGPDPDLSPPDLGWTGGSDDQDFDGTPVPGDCDDHDPGRPRAEVPCDGVDDDCDPANDCPTPPDHTGLPDGHSAAPPPPDHTGESADPPPLPPKSSEDPGCGCATGRGPSVAALAALAALARRRR